MKKFISLIIVVAVIAAGIIYVPKLVHRCTDCDSIFVGTGYEPNVIGSLISDEEQILCEECAREHHALALAMGKALDDFKKELK